MSESIPPPQKSRRRNHRFLPFVLIFLAVVVGFMGGGAAFFYLIFSEYSGVRNIWLLVCGAPVVVLALVFLTVYSLYARFGQPMEQILNAIDSIAEGNLAVRVREDNSPQFGELIKRFNKMVDELERAGQQRRNLTADIAHELRTPLHIIQGNLEGILDGVYPPSPEHINNTLEETRLLSRLVSDLQTLSLAESGQLPLHPTRFLLADLLQDLASSFGPQAAAQGIDLQTGLDDPARALTGDYDRLNQVLSNLISNALRHTPDGGRVVLQAGATASGPHTVQLTLQDSGAGIPAADLPFIFDRFWRADRSRSNRMHSGLGLAIAYQLVQAHGGEIMVESEVGQGTVFTIRLP